MNVGCGRVQTAVDSIECTWKRKWMSWQHSLRGNTALLVSKEDGILHSSHTLMVGNLKRLNYSLPLPISLLQQLSPKSSVESQCKAGVINYICPIEIKIFWLHFWGAFMLSINGFDTIMQCPDWWKNTWRKKSLHMLVFYIIWQPFCLVTKFVYIFMCFFL